MCKGFFMHSKTWQCLTKFGSSHQRQGVLSTILTVFVVINLCMQAYSDSSTAFDSVIHAEFISNHEMTENLILPISTAQQLSMK